LGDGDISTRKDIYRIKVLGRLDASWSDWFNGMAVIFLDGVTVLTGEVADQSVLHGLLAKIRDLNLTLVSLEPLPIETQGTNDDTREEN